MSTPNPTQYVTLIARNAADAMIQFRDLGLANLGYSIVGRIGPHSVMILGADGQLEHLRQTDGMVAATFHKSAAADPHAGSNHHQRS